MRERDLERAATRLSADYCRLLDGRDAEGWSRLFTADGRLDLGRRQVVGRETLREFAAASPAGVHMAGPMAVDDDQGEITSESPFVFVNARTGAVLAGYYRDRLAWHEDRLVFVVRGIDIRVSPPPAAA